MKKGTKRGFETCFLHRQLKSYMVDRDCDTYKELAYKLVPLCEQFKCAMLPRYINGKAHMPKWLIECISCALELSEDEKRKLYEAHVKDLIYHLSGKVPTVTLSV